MVKYFTCLPTPVVSSKREGQMTTGRIEEAHMLDGCRAIIVTERGVIRVDVDDDGEMRVRFVDDEQGLAPVRCWMEEDLCGRG